MRKALTTIAAVATLTLATVAAPQSMPRRVTAGLPLEFLADSLSAP